MTKEKHSALHDLNEVDASQDFDMSAFDEEIELAETLLEEDSFEPEWAAEQSFNTVIGNQQENHNEQLAESFANEYDGTTSIKPSRPKLLRYGPVLAFLMIVTFFVLPTLLGDQGTATQRHSTELIDPGGRDAEVKPMSTATPTQSNSEDAFLEKLRANHIASDSIETNGYQLAEAVQSQDYINKKQERQALERTQTQAAIFRIDEQRFKDLQQSTSQLDKKLVEQAQALQNQSLKSNSLELALARLEKQLKVLAVKKPHRANDVAVNKTAYVMFHQQDESNLEPNTNDELTPRSKFEDLASSEWDKNSQTARQFIDAVISGYTPSSIAVVTRQCNTKVLRPGDSLDGFGRVTKLTNARAYSHKGYYLSLGSFAACASPGDENVAHESSSVQPIIRLPNASSAGHPRGGVE
ncbi:MAG: hypothetical protein AAF197_06085 [Pseudomonadota bacterium]